MSKKKKLAAHPLATAFAIWAATLMFIMWVLANMGLYTTMAQAMTQWHLFFNLSVSGLVGGMIEAAVGSYVGAYLFVLIYNSISTK